MQNKKLVRSKIDNNNIYIKNVDLHAPADYVFVAQVVVTAAVFIEESKNKKLVRSKIDNKTINELKTYLFLHTSLL